MSRITRIIAAALLFVTFALMGVLCIVVGLSCIAAGAAPLAAPMGLAAVLCLIIGAVSARETVNQ